MSIKGESKHKVIRQMLRHFPETTASAQTREPIKVDEEGRSEGAIMTTSMPPPTKVVIEAQALLRIVKHAQDAHGRQAQGRLTGMQFGSVLEVSCAVPAIQTPLAATTMTEEERDERDAKDEAQLIDLMARAGLDTFVVGRYVCCSQNVHLTSRHLSFLQEAIVAGSPPVLLHYDPVRSSMGKLYLRALTPTAAFFNYLRDGVKTADALVKNGVDSAGLFDDVPVEFATSTAGSIILADVATTLKPVANELVASGELGRFTERSMQQLTDSLDRLRNEVNMRQNPGPNDKAADGTHPLRVEGLLLAHQLKEQAIQIEALGAGVALSLDFARADGAI